MTTSEADPQQVLADIETSNRFLVQQVFKPIANEYRISIPAPGSTDEGRPLLFVKQKKMKIKEDIRFRLDPERDEHLFMIKSKSMFEFRGRHEVLGADGQVIGLLERRTSRTRSSAATGTCATRRDRALRGARGELDHGAASPHRGPRPGLRLAPGLAAVQLRPRAGGQHVGTYKRVLGKIRDRYVLELDDAFGDADRRLVLAFAVALDALQDR